VRNIIVRAIDGRKLLVTIPWLVEYLAMLDFITIRLDYYRELFRMLYTIYLRVNVVDGHNGLCVMPQSKFIIRTCLGWLFEHPAIPEDYYNFNAKTNLSIALHSERGGGDGDEEEGSQQLERERQEQKRGEMNCCIGNDAELNSHLESLIHSACPFLADFRVSMMPQRITKAVSRTGRYRHITTKIQDKSTTTGETKQVRK
jgi:codanin-1